MSSGQVKVDLYARCEKEDGTLPVTWHLDLVLEPLVSLRIRKSEEGRVQEGCWCFAIGHHGFEGLIQYPCGGASTESGEPSSKVRMEQNSGLAVSDPGVVEWEFTDGGKKGQDLEKNLTIYEFL